MWDLQGVQSFPKNLAESEGLKFNVRSSHVEIWQMESGVWSKQADWDCGQRPGLRKKLGYKPHPLRRGVRVVLLKWFTRDCNFSPKRRLKLDSKTTIEENPPWPPTLQNCSLSWKVALVQSQSNRAKIDIDAYKRKAGWNSRGKTMMLGCLV